MIRASPRWDGHRMLFMLATEDGREVRCAISRLALLGISGSAPFRGADLPAVFAAARQRIEAAALTKLRARSTLPLGVLHIWEEDILDPEPTEVAACALGAERKRG